MTEEELLEWLYADLDEIIDMVGDDDNDIQKSIEYRPKMDC